MSFSRLSDYDRNGSSALLDKKDNNNSIALNKGSLINDLLFETVDFNSKYTLKIYEKPTATLLRLANIIIENFVNIPTHEEVEKIIENNEFWKTTKKENIKSKYDLPEFWDYITNQIKPDGKIAITPSMKIEADEIVYILRNHKHSSHFFDKNKYEIIPEYAFEVDYNLKDDTTETDRTIILRGIVDMIVVDHINKTIRLVDLKTGGDKASEFEYSFTKWRYYLQESVYMYAMDHIKELLGYSDYTTLNFQFLYIGLKEKIPVVFDVTDTWHEAALNGFYTKSGTHYKGLHQLIREVAYIWYNKEFETPYELLEKNGVVALNDDFIETNK